MEELQKQLAKASYSLDKEVYNNPIQALRPSFRSAHKHALQRIVLSDTHSWSLNSQATVTSGATTTIQLSQKGIIDLKRSYISFTLTQANARVYNINSLFEVLNWSIGSLSFNNPYVQPLVESLSYRQDRLQLSHSGEMADWVFSKVANSGANTEFRDSIINACIQPGVVQVSIPLVNLCYQFAEMEHVFVGLGQIFQIQMRCRAVDECMVYTANNPSYTVGNGQICLQYVDLDSADFDDIIKSRIQLPITVHQVQPTAMKSSTLNFQLSVSKNDIARSLVLCVQGKTDGTAIQALGDITTNVSNVISGVLKPRPPMRRITIVYGQQQIVLQGQRLEQLQDLNLSDHCYTHQYFANQMLFSPIIIDMTRFGIRWDEYGGEQQSSGQVLLITVEFKTDAKYSLALPQIDAGYFAPGAQSNLTMYCYLLSQNQFSIENGLYKRD